MRTKTIKIRCKDSKSSSASLVESLLQQKTNKNENLQHGSGTSVHHYRMLALQAIQLLRILPQVGTNQLRHLPVVTPKTSLMSPQFWHITAGN
jgi:hypothetical protein